MASWGWDDFDPTTKRGWQNIGGVALAPVTGGASIGAMDSGGGTIAGDIWGDLSGKDAADEQAAAIQEAAAIDRGYNFPNVVGPGGSRTVTRDPVTGEVTVTEALSPEMKAIVSGLRGDLGTSRGSVEDALYGRATSRLDPQWGDRMEAQRTRLYNMGLREGDAAFDKQMRNLDFARTDAYDAARNQAVAAGGAEQSRLLSALMAAQNPGLGRYWGSPNATDAAIAAGNIQSQVPTGLEFLLGLGGIAAKAYGGK